MAGADAGTDLAVIRVDAGTGKAMEKAEGARVGELVLAVGRSSLGDISASAGIVARLGSGWRTWHGGRIDSLIRPDVQLYVGQAGSALAGMQEGDVVVGFATQPVGGIDDLHRLLTTERAGKPQNVSLLRGTLLKHLMIVPSERAEDR